jgi:hypothetical protein
VLAAGDDAGVGQAGGEGQGAGGHPLGGGGERAVADDRIGRIGVHVQDRGEVDVEAERGQLGPGRADAPPALGPPRSDQLSIGGYCGRIAIR